MEMLFQPLKVAPGRHLDERQRIADCAGADAEVDRQFGNLVPRNRHGLLGALTLQERRFRADRDRFGGRAYLQHHVNAGGDRDLYLYIGLFVFAEAGLLDDQRVGAYRQLQYRVVTGSGRDGVGLRTRLGIGEDHLDAWDQRAGGI